MGDSDEDTRGWATLVAILWQEPSFCRVFEPDIGTRLLRAKISDGRAVSGGFMKRELASSTVTEGIDESHYPSS